MPENLPFASSAPFVVINRYSRDSKRCGCSAGRNYEMRERRENVLEVEGGIALNFKNIGEFPR